MIINAYFMNKYCWFFNVYYINAYWWILVVITLMAIVG